MLEDKAQTGGENDNVADSDRDDAAVAVDEEAGDGVSGE